MYVKFILVLMLLLAVTGCTTMTDAMSKASGMGVVTQERSAFDNATVLSVSPAPLWAQGSWGNLIKLGAQWSSAAPDSVALVLAYNSNVSGYGATYLGLDSIDINLDGQITSYSAGQPTHLSSSGYNTVSKTIYTSSQNSVVVPYSVFKRMVSAKDCRLRIHTSKGTEDSQFSIERIPGGQGTAILFMREFMVKVDAARENG